MKKEIKDYNDEMEGKGRENKRGTPGSGEESRRKSRTQKRCLDDWRNNACTLRGIPASNVRMSQLLSSSPASGVAAGFCFSHPARCIAYCPPTSQFPDS